jgi:hypothetical protein
MHIQAKSTLISVTDASSSTSLGVTKSNKIILQNTGSNMAFATTGVSTTTITYPVAGTPASGTFIPPGFSFTMQKNLTDTHIVVIAASGTSTTITVQAGEGV